MNAVTAARASLDLALLAQPSEATRPTARVGANGTSQNHDEIVSVTRSASLLAALHTRLDEANSAALAERADSGGDPSNGDPERLQKLYPPYPTAFNERAAILDRLAGLGKLNKSLRLPAEKTVESQSQGQSLALSVAERLAASPRASVSRQSAPLRFINLEGAA